MLLKCPRDPNDFGHSCELGDSSRPKPASTATLATTLAAAPGESEHVERLLAVGRGTEGNHGCAGEGAQATSLCGRLRSGTRAHEHGGTPVLFASRGRGAVFK